MAISRSFVVNAQLSSRGALFGLLGVAPITRTSIRISKVRHSRDDQQDEECRDDYGRNEPAHNVIPPALHSFTLAIAKSLPNFGEVLVVTT
jgi:hypothetical protein